MQRPPALDPTAEDNPQASPESPWLDYLRVLVTRALPGRGGDFQVIPLQGDASDRHYYRLEFAVPVDGITSLVLMCLAEPYTNGELPFVNVQRYLRQQGIPVPAIFWDAAVEGFVLLEDLGDQTLAAILQDAPPERVAEWYRQALDLLLRLQHPKAVQPPANCIAFSLAFDVEKLTWELDFFLTHMLKNLCAQQLSPADETALQAQFYRLAETLARQPRVFAHRDYHSRNLMVQHDQLRLIDFQDARLGPCQYDVASLLYDSYVVLPADLREELLQDFIAQQAEQSGHPADPDTFHRIFDYMSLQRNLKALGTFAYQTTVKRSRRYLEAIPPTLGYIRGHLAKHPELQQLSDLLEHYLFTAFPNGQPDAVGHTPDRSPVHSDKTLGTGG